MPTTVTIQPNLRIEVPTWHEARQAVEAGSTKAIDQFVYHNEPSGAEVEKEFRDGLQAVILDVAIAMKECL